MVIVVAVIVVVAIAVADEDGDDNNDIKHTKQCCDTSFGSVSVLPYQVGFNLWHSHATSRDLIIFSAQHYKTNNQCININALCLVCN